MEFGFEPVCNQLWTSSKPASIMEFGFTRKCFVAYRHFRWPWVAFNISRPLQAFTNATFSYSCVAVDNISTDIRRSISDCWASCSLILLVCLGLSVSISAYLDVPVYYFSTAYKCFTFIYAKKLYMTCIAGIGAVEVVVTERSKHSAVLICLLLCHI